MPDARPRSIDAGMPSLSITNGPPPVLPAASNARTSNVSALPGATGSVTGTVTCHVPEVGDPSVRVAATPLTVTPVTLTASTARTSRSTVDAATSASVDGDV